jgi:quinol monooxygenase YgiN
MSISLIVSGVGAVAAAIALGMLLMRCSRAPRGDLIAWSVALFGLFVALGAQALGHLSGFSQLTFRAMEIGAQVVAPLALIMGIAEVVGTSLPAKFAARLFIPSLAIIPLVIFSIDPLSGTSFTRAWPAPSVYYQIIPNKLQEYGLSPLTLLVAIIMVGVAAWRAVHSRERTSMLVAVGAAGIAVLALALPGLAPVLSDHLGLTLPLSSLFAVLCLLAAALTWYAGVSAARLPLAALQGGAGRDRDGYDGAGRRGGAGGGEGAYDDRDDDSWGGGERWNGADQTGNFDAYDDGSQGVYRGAGLYRDEPAGTRDYPADDYQDGDYDSRELDPAYGPGGYDTGSHDGYEPEGQPPGYRAGEYAAAAVDPAYAGQRPAEPAEFGQAAAPAAREETTRAQLFGQIAIYTLIEDGVREFDRLTERVVGQVRGGEPDTLVFIVHAVPSAPMQRILYEVYRDRAAFDRHQQQPYVAEFEEDRRPYVLATNVIELGLQQAKVSPFPSIVDLFGEPGYDTSGFERPDYTREYGTSAGQNGTPP